MEETTTLNENEISDHKCEISEKVYNNKLKLKKHFKAVHTTSTATLVANHFLVKPL